MAKSDIGKKLPFVVLWYSVQYPSYFTPSHHRADHITLTRRPEGPYFLSHIPGFITPFHSFSLARSFEDLSLPWVLYLGGRSQRKTEAITWGNRRKEKEFIAHKSMSIQGYRALWRLSQILGRKWDAGYIKVFYLTAFTPYLFEC